MKRFFTLIAGILLVSSGAFAQDKWTNVITNGNMEGEDFSCFKSQEVATPGDERDVKDPRVVEDSKKPGNHCIIIRARSAAEAEKESLDRYDTQFFVISNGSAEITAGKDIRITLKIRAEKNGRIGTQAHSAPGSFLDYNTFGEFDVTTEWKKYTLPASGKYTIAEGHATATMTTLALDLTTSTEENIFYFDDIKMEVRDHQEDQPQEGGGWFNFLPEGSLTNMEMVLPCYDENAPTLVTNFNAREGAIATKGVKNENHKANLVEDPVRGKVLTLQSIGYNAKHEVKTQVEVKDEEGNPVLDEEGNPTYTEEISYVDIFIRENGDTVKKNDGSLGVEDWATQFFASCPHEFKPGDKMKVHFFYRADKAATVNTQIHHGPGAYAFYQMLGDLNFTEEWQEFDQEVQVNTSNDAHGTTLAFNCNVLKEVNNYYFDFVEFSADMSDVTIDDRTLEKADIIAPVPAANEEVNIKIDMTDMIKTLKIDDLTGFLNENTMKVLMKEVIEPEDPEDDPEIKEKLSGDMQATTGVYINNLGSYIDEEDGIVLTFPEEGIEGNTATLNIFNLTGEVKAGENINTTICFVKDGWFYTMNLTLVTPEDYEVINGVATVKADLNRKGTIYDLFGRKVTKATKGLYIKDGKKFFIK
jgi:hypothetical protein